MTEPLSPAALTVWNRFCGIVEEHGPARLGLAAALRAAVDQVVPETKGPRNQLEYALGDWDARDDVRDGLLAIAAELEAANG